MHLYSEFLINYFLKSLPESICFIYDNSKIDRDKELQKYRIKKRAGIKEDRSI